MRWTVKERSGEAARARALRERPAARPSALRRTVPAVTAAAVAGSLATSPRSEWYATLRKPSWQPPPVAFPVVWTPLYGLIAIAGARAMDRSGAAGHGALARSYATNLVLNAAWTPLFFAARAPRLALAEIFALNVSNAALVRRAWRADRAAGLMLLPYAGWTVFATALNLAIVRRNPRP